jgi:hypothetical protein
MERPTRALRDESAALKWAIESFRNNDNAHNFKDESTGRKERLAYNKMLLSLLSSAVETIDHGGAQSIVVPESTEQLHRMDQDELVSLIA